MLAVPELPADESRMLTLATADTGDLDAASENASVGDVFVGGVAVGALTDTPIEEQVTAPGKPPSRQRQQKFTIIGPGANAFTPVPSTQAVSVSPPDSLALASPAISHSGRCLEATKVSRQSPGQPVRGHSGPVSQTKAAQKRVQQAAQGRSQVQVKSRPPALRPKVKCSKETFPGGLQLLKIRMPGSDKDGYYVKSTAGTLIQVTQVVMSEDKVSQLKLAVNKPILAADILNEADDPQSARKASLLKPSPAARSGSNTKGSKKGPAYGNTKQSSSTPLTASPSMLPASLYLEVPSSTVQNMPSNSVQYLPASVVDVPQPEASCINTVHQPDKTNDADFPCDNAAYTPEALQSLIATLQGSPDNSQTADLSALAEAAAAALEIKNRNTESGVSSPQVAETKGLQAPRSTSMAGYQIQTEDGQMIEVQHVTSDGVQYAQEGQLFSTSTVEMVQNVLTQSGFVLDDSQAVTYQQDDSQTVTYQQDDYQALTYQQDDRPGANYQQDDSQTLTYPQVDQQALIYQQVDSQAVTHPQVNHQVLTYQQDDSQAVTYQQDDSQTLTYPQVDQQALIYQQVDSQAVTHPQVNHQVLAYQQNDSQAVTCQQDDSQAVTCQQDDSQAVTYQQDDSQAVTCQQDDSQAVTCQQDDSQAVIYQQDDSQTVTYQQDDSQGLAYQEVSCSLQTSQSQHLVQLEQPDAEDAGELRTEHKQCSMAEHVVKFGENQRYQETATEHEQVQMEGVELYEQVKGRDSIKLHPTGCQLPLEEVLQQGQHVEQGEPVQVPLGQDEQYQGTQIAPGHTEQYGYVQVLPGQLEQYQQVHVLEQVISAAPGDHVEQVHLEQVNSAQHYELSDGTLEAEQHVQGQVVQESEGSAKVEVQPVVPGLTVTTGMDLLADVINSTLLAENVPHDAV